MPACCKLTASIPTLLALTLLAHSYNTGHHAVNLLFQTGTYDIFNAYSLALFFVIYFVLAAITAGASFPSGLVIPMLTMGKYLSAMIVHTSSPYLDANA